MRLFDLKVRLYERHSVWRMIGSNSRRSFLEFQMSLHFYLSEFNGRILKAYLNWSRTWAKFWQLIACLFAVLPQLNLTKSELNYLLKSDFKDKIKNKSIEKIWIHLSSPISNSSLLLECGHKWIDYPVSFPSIVVVAYVEVGRANKRSFDNLSALYQLSSPFDEKSMNGCGTTHRFLYTCSKKGVISSVRKHFVLFRVRATVRVRVGFSGNTFSVKRVFEKVK